MVWPRALPKQFNSLGRLFQDKQWCEGEKEQGQAP